MNLRRKRQRDITLELAPLIDVVFLLLIFFMVTTSFTQQSHVSLSLPTSQNAPVLNQSQQLLRIVIDNREQISINDRILINSEIESIEAGLRNMSDNDVNRPILIMADKDARVQTITAVFNAAGNIGFKDIVIATEQNNNIP